MCAPILKRQYIYNFNEQTNETNWNAFYTQTNGNDIRDTNRIWKHFDTILYEIEKDNRSRFSFKNVYRQKTQNNKESSYQSKSNHLSSNSRLKTIRVEVGNILWKFFNFETPKVNYF
jgi:hypothetical protein